MLNISENSRYSKYSREIRHFTLPYTSPLLNRPSLPTLDKYKFYYNIQANSLVNFDNYA